jgi:hypothetical protein
MREPKSWLFSNRTLCSQQWAPLTPNVAKIGSCNWRQHDVTSLKSKSFSSQSVISALTGMAARRPSRRARGDALFCGRLSEQVGIAVSKAAGTWARCRPRRRSGRSVPSCDAQRNVVAHLSTHCIRPQTVSARNKPTAASRALRSSRPPRRKPPEPISASSSSSTTTVSTTLPCARRPPLSYLIAVAVQLAHVITPSLHGPFP